MYPDCLIVHTLFWPPPHKVLQSKPGSHPYIQNTPFSDSMARWPFPALQLSLTRGNNLLTQCLVTDWSRWKRTYQPGISWGGVGNNFTNNRLSNAPHAGILGGGQLLVIHYCIVGRRARAVQYFERVFVHRITLLWAVPDRAVTYWKYRLQSDMCSNPTQGSSSKLSLV